MKRGFVGAILAGVCVVLGVAVAYVSSKQDRTDPVITVSEDALTYTEGEGTEGIADRSDSNGQRRWGSYKGYLCGKSDSD